MFRFAANIILFAVLGHGKHTDRQMNKDFRLRNSDDVIIRERRAVTTVVSDTMGDELDGSGLHQPGVTQPAEPQPGVTQSGLTQSGDEVSGDEFPPGMNF